MIIKEIRGGSDVNRINQALPRGGKQLLKMAIMLSLGSEGRNHGESIVKDDVELG